MDIFNFLGSIFGYILYFFYMILQNYGLAIIVFTILVRAAMFPLNIKQQRSSAASGRIAEKQKELSVKYANDKEKYQEELEKLYAAEGASPSTGCLTTLIPFPIMLGLYYAIIYPLSNALHLASSSINAATMMLNQIPGISSSFSTRFVELEVVRNFDTLKPYLSSVWTADEIASVDKFAHSCNFLGLDLLQTPWGGQAILWIIPILCLLIGVGTQVYSMFANEAMRSQQGCMKVTMLLMPLLTAYLALTMPGAIGFYWMISNLATFAQVFVTNKFYSRDHVIANREARRIARREKEEALVPEIPLAERRVITSENVRNQGTANRQKKKKK
ncbi:MAG: YidC/Oxa1 family membrane protein insertase [Oscillospiraceae bacterium]|nr:YidC/Oxa1 family membrane protein insertase [Oscillospiraceae bacterium]